MCGHTRCFQQPAIQKNQPELVANVGARGGDISDCIPPGAARARHDIGCFKHHLAGPENEIHIALDHAVHKVAAPALHKQCVLEAQKTHVAKGCAIAIEPGLERHRLSTVDLVGVILWQGVRSQEVKAVLNGEVPSAEICCLDGYRGGSKCAHGLSGSRS